MTTANKITVVRILMIPAFVTMATFGVPLWPFIAQKNRGQSRLA